MKCACGGATYLSPEDYAAEVGGAHIDCSHCGDSIHFGVAVAGLRDENDPALDDAALVELAWYHTSTFADWPSADYAVRFDQELEWGPRMFWTTRERYVEEHSTKALHVGTYEAAIENMLRRMDDQADAGSQFYLYRVALRSDVRRINAGFRDENHEEAADLNVSDLDEAGLDAIRYLNVHEAVGGLSLALRPGAIAAVQSLPIPLNGLSVPIQPDALKTPRAELATAERALREARTVTAALDPRVKRAMQLGIHDDPSGFARRERDLELEYFDAWGRLEASLAETSLKKVSPLIVRDFHDAISRWRADEAALDVDDFVKRYLAMGALLNLPHEVIGALSREDWREVNPD